MGEKALIIRLIAICTVLLFSSGCVPLLIAGGAGAAAGYYAGKHYDVEIESPVKVKRKDEE
ncbi:hypothetical protein Dester_0301 [Desulfurobacterium thermolithotrophum DSM 11699]|uniref:Lipoprotein n=1 Tax=Desulfurobacterium thermolithotrophum (strain DSM 11699 / BSA) TaxID=868864 RepID=F0S1V2_DESTD|nr:hypothetical protein [Desulfurobacterium thermolithotrophum]ADY72957.1 hypothetical protein Dester_0301 [Desulfurobacterium thermolithotrophum DSM 11699]